MEILLNEWYERFEAIKASLHHSIENGDPRVKDWPLVYSPWPMLSLCVLYMIICFIGPKLMAKRQPFELKGVLIVYNFGMVLLSVYMFKELFLSSSALKYTYLCDPLHYGTDEWSMRLAAGIWLFYFSKLIEFLDTIFFILRKKNNQITFLHVYHHISMFFLWWIAAKWFAGGSAFFSPMLNCFVHTIMYTYYMLSAFGERVRKHLWWKKYVTVLQMMQFFIVIAQNAYALYTNCDYDKRAEWSCVIYLSSLFILFMNFFIRSYVWKPRSQRHESSTGPVTVGEGQYLYSRTVKANGGLHRQADAKKDK